MTKSWIPNIKPQVKTTIENGKKTEIQTYNGEISIISVWEDLNNDGKFSDNELTSVTRYGKRFDSELNELEGYQTETFIDTDQDGYDDYKITTEYDKDGNFVKSTKLKSKEQPDYLKHNSKMETHRSGYYINII